MALDVAEKNGESLSDSEVKDILKGADLEEKDAESFKGQGGICVVIAVAIFSSLAGLLMGLDIGYIAGVKSMKTFAHDLLQHDGLMELEDSVITMIFGLGAALAAFPPVMQACVSALGRKGAVVAGGWFFCLGAALQCAAMNLAMMLLGRLTSGFSVGLLSGNAPVYTSEIAPPAVRGALVMGFQFAVTVGIMLAFLLALVLEDVEDPISGWRWVIAAQIVPGSLLILGAFMPGSPRHLLANGKIREALQTLRKLRREDVSFELAQIYLEYEASSEASWLDFLTGDNGKLLRIGVMIQILAQICGMNAFMYHGPVIFKLIFQSDHAGLLFTVVSGVVNIVATIPALLVVDRYGRTFLMKWSALGMMSCSAVLAAVGDICLQGEDFTCGDWARATCTVAICGFILNFAYGPSWGSLGRSDSCVAMAPGVVVEKHEESLSHSEVKEILKRADLEEDAESFKGQGGISVVIAVASFSSLAGLLMGLDIGYIAGVKTMKSFSRDLLQRDDLMELEDSVITMIFGLGAALAAFPPVMQACVSCLGRKGAVVAGGSIFCLGSGLQCIAINMTMMLLGRITAGFSVGLLSGNAPVYTSEIAPPALRGALVTGFQFAVTVGIMVAFLLALVLEDVEEPVSGWRWVIAAQMVPGSLLVLGGAFMPGSPRQMVAQGKMKEALQTLRKLRKEDVSLEFAQIYLEHEASSSDASWREFLTGDNGKLLRIGLIIQLLGQICGMNAFMYDGPVIFKLIFQSDHAGLLFTVVSGVVNILATIPALLVVDRCGRTFLMKWSALGMMTCSAVLAAVGDICLDGENFACGNWAKATCTVAICGFILNFAYGWGGMPWVYCSEMFPQKYRTKGVGATTDANWVGNILIAFVPPLMFAHWGFDTFWVFVGTNMLCLWLAMILPETKDKSLEEITYMFNSWLKGRSEV